MLHITHPDGDTQPVSATPVEPEPEVAPASSMSALAMGMTTLAVPAGLAIGALVQGWEGIGAAIATACGMFVLAPVAAALGLMRGEGMGIPALMMSGLPCLWILTRIW